MTLSGRAPSGNFGRGCRKCEIPHNVCIIWGFMENRIIKGPMVKEASLPCRYVRQGTCRRGAKGRYGSVLREMRNR